MSDYINKIVTLLLVFLMLVLGPLTFSYLSDEMTSKRLILNDVTTFLDKVTDQAVITDDDLNDFYLALNSHGMVLDATVTRYIATPYVGVDGKAESGYFIVDDIKELNSGDIIKVSVEEIAISPGRRLMYYVLKVDTGKYRLDMAASVG